MPQIITAENLASAPTFEGAPGVPVLVNGKTQFAYRDSYTKPRISIGGLPMEFPLPDQGYIADQVFVPFMAQKKSANFAVIKRESLLRDRDVDRAPGSASNRTAFGAADHSYNCQQKSQEIALDHDDIEQAMDDFDNERAAALLSADIILRAREVATKDATFNTTTWTGSDLFTDNSGSPWSTTSTDILDQIMDARNLVVANCGMKPNTLVVSAAQLPNIVLNDEVAKRLQYANTLTFDFVAQVFGALIDIPNVVIGGAVHTSVAEGESYDGSYIWPKTYCWLGVTAQAPDVPRSMPAVGRRFVWQARQGSADVVVDAYEEEQTQSTVWRAREWRDINLYDANYGHLIQIEA